VDNGRIIIPPEWRPEGAPKDFMVILWPTHAPAFALVLPPARWELLLQRLEALPLSNEDAAWSERQIGSSTFERSTDGYGRLLLPEEALEIIGPGDEALLVGRIKEFEIWNPKRFEAEKEAHHAERRVAKVESVRI
jgi:DNA-binding transcriptional regulator/RsmH inhibitor MraZ